MPQHAATYTGGGSSNGLSLTGQMLSHYDETAGVAIPHHLVSVHASMGHSVVPLQDAYMLRMNRLQAMSSSRLLPKREHLVQLARQLQAKSSEVNEVRRGIERETMDDTDRIVERLRAAESMRQASIAQQLNVVTTEVEAIDRVLKQIDIADGDMTSGGVNDGVRVTTGYPPSAVTMPGDSAAGGMSAWTAGRASKMVEVIHRYSDVTSTMERLASRSVSVHTDFPDDLPKETASRLDVLSRCDRYAHALQVKDQMLWTALKDKERLEMQLSTEQELSREYGSEVTEWVGVAQRLGGELEAAREEQLRMQDTNHRLMQLLRDHGIITS